jgi:hypothetical protein
MFISAVVFAESIIGFIAVHSIMFNFLDIIRGNWGVTFVAAAGLTVTEYRVLPLLVKCPAQLNACE